MNRTLAIVITVVTALCCGCLALLSCIWGGLIASGQPVTVTGADGSSSIQTLPAPLGFTLICVSLILIIIPIAVGFFTLRNKPAEPVINEPLPPVS